MTTLYLALVLLLLFLVAPTQGFFLLPTTKTTTATRLYSSTTTTTSTTSTTTNTKASLSQRCPWTLSVVIKKEGFPDVQTDLQLRFVEEPEYEPPQGRIFIERDPLAIIDTDDKGFVALPNPSWTLSEDKEDRKWGLWIWGLLAEPLYPYLYFSLPVMDDCLVEVVSSQEGGEVKKTKEFQPLFGGGGIPGKRLEFRFDHKREEGAVKLSEGKMTYKEVEMQKVDALGWGGEVNVGDVKPAGEAQLRPALN